MSDEGRRDRIYVFIGRLESIKHSLHWFLRPPPSGLIPAENENKAEVVRAKARDLREIADDLDDLADDIEVPS